MALKTDIRGMVHIYPDHFVVGREKIREYAKAFTTLMGQQTEATVKINPM